jgi:hypothetical protein
LLCKCRRHSFCLLLWNYLGINSKNPFTNPLQRPFSDDFWPWECIQEAACDPENSSGSWLLCVHQGPVILTKFSMCGLKFWKAYENLRQKPVFEILSGFLHFWLLSSQKVFIVPIKRWKLFFFKYGKWSLKKVLAIKLFYPLKNLYKKTDF